MTIKKKESAPATKAKGKPKQIEPTLRRPRWTYWIAKEEVTLEQATALSLGLEPVRGLVGLLRQRKRRMLEYRKRLLALKSDYGRNPWLPRGKSLPNLYRVRGFLEYAHEQSWDLQRNVLDALERVRRSGPLVEFGKPGVESPVEAARRPSAGTFEVSVPDALRVGAPEAATHTTAEMGKRAELNLQRTFGALVLLVEKLVLDRSVKAYLRGTKLNKSALARALLNLVSEEEQVSLPVSGFDQRAIEMRINAALELFPTKAKSFKLEESEPQDPTTPDGGSDERKPSS